MQRLDRRRTADFGSVEIPTSRARSLGFAVLALLLIGVWAAAYASQERGAELSTRPPDFRYDVYSEQEVALYRIDIKPIKPDSGIDSGHVLVYGHYIRPPYVVSVEDSSVLINGVSVRPQLTPPGLQRRLDSLTIRLSESESATEAAYERMMHEAQGIYADSADRLGDEVALGIAVIRIQASGLVDSVRQEQHGGVLVFRLGGSAFRRLLTHSEIEAGRAAEGLVSDVPASLWLERMADSYRGTLMRGSTLFFAAGQSASLGGRQLGQFWAIMGNETLTPAARYHALADGQIPFAAWFVANYDREEWRDARGAR